MGKGGLRFYTLLLCSVFMIGGCNFLQEPVTLIQAPQYAEAASELEKTLLIKSKDLLPIGAVLTTASQPAGSEAVIKADLNGDGTNEMIYLYQSIGNKEQIGAFILMNDKGEWNKAAEIKGTGYEVSWASSADITGDGKPELLLGWKIGASAGNVLDIFSWGESGLEKLAQLNYHELEVLLPEDKKDSQARLAIWNREMADVYKTDILKWEQTAFHSDLDYYPAYFANVSDYYEERAKHVPSAPYYWYYLADARLKEGYPELALQAIENGMNLKITFPSRTEFEDLKLKIEDRLKNNGTVPFYNKEADFTMDIPRKFANNLMINGVEGVKSNYIIGVSKAMETGQTDLLFTIEVYPKEWISSIEDYGLTPLLETEKLSYGIRKENIKDPKDLELANQIIATIRPGAYFPKLKSQEEQILLKLIQLAVRKYWYVTSGGKMEEGLIENFPINDMDYRYMGSDLDTKEKLIEYLSSAYSIDAINQYMESAGIVEHNGKLAQPNADGGSIASYEKSAIYLTKDVGSEKEFDLKIPLGDSLVTVMVHVVLKKTDKGWRIDSLPGSF
ncbi:DL-endopeptidase inhibitor IseA family protein [Bacillus sp. S/N-304-OC-R1]|uniref:DL-endopeptidase inhibitor IseA family protein n=1 Tax=Bacillus sp. S/N-304-OC-R1 TaxID=2758034 RepID=UPI001C8E372B|nr:DL-endopeptidase inhibitor IseA family protein [Bacillus sp. S/N-304-OC-R1]MBY0123148.1 hypothetical protein [Bacillus sp. S/N-304-OC-R1]